KNRGEQLPGVELSLFVEEGHKSIARTVHRLLVKSCQRLRPLNRHHASLDLMQAETQLTQPE
ncbi:MAG: hypothetical protein KDD44_12290, partial [Bdellovibrionales bacterium]|nr:hypothetical protein [Bdellovibrionales bacterium]